LLKYNLNGQTSYFCTDPLMGLSNRMYWIGNEDTIENILLKNGYRLSDTVLLRLVSAMKRDVDCLPMVKPVNAFKSIGDPP
jgi:hypothetical protein